MRRGWGRVLGAVAAAVSASACGGRTGDEAARPWEASGQAAATTFFVERLTVQFVDKIDLLFVIDNSISMADKQALLRLSVPQLVRRLVDPVCVDGDSGQPCGDDSSTDSDGCACGRPEMRPFIDIHVGVITSSLGGHGGTICTPAHGEQYWNPTQNDRAHLISRGGDGSEVRTWRQAGFLSWDPWGQAFNPAPHPDGTADQDALIADFQNLVTGAGERGCGYEATLEAWYRFLIDPEPPLDVFVEPATGIASPVGVDEELLAQRAQFLRPDSLLAIVMLSDENDCSVRDDEFGYLIGSPNEGAVPRSTSACDVDPNDPCCLSCIQADWPEGCGDIHNDPTCQVALLHPREEDRLNLRCYNQRQRFGLDLLYPTSRYVDGLSSRQVPRRDGTRVPNPLYSVSAHPLAGDYVALVPRLDSSLVFLVGIIGVPWQDIATQRSLEHPTELEYLSTAEISSLGLWDEILGQPHARPPVPPEDPFMRESIAPRSGVNPRTGIFIDPPQPGAGGNAINGHEYTILNNSDLQYACIYPLLTPKECVDVPPGVGCDCMSSPDVLDRPLCDGLTQSYANAYPGARFLEVLRDYGANSIVASICAKNAGLGDMRQSDPSFGYNPAFNAVVDRLAPTFQRACWPHRMRPDESGRLPCVVVEATRFVRPAPCAGYPGRSAPDPAAAEAVRRRMREIGLCGDSLPCDSFSLCQLQQTEGNALTDCLHAADEDVTSYGFCFIDAMTDTDGDGVLECEVGGPRDDCIGNPELVANCPARQRRDLRLVSPPSAEVPLPWPHCVVFIACQTEP